MSNYSHVDTLKPNEAYCDAPENGNIHKTVIKVITRHWILGTQAKRNV